MGDMRGFEDVRRKGGSNCELEISIWLLHSVSLCFVKVYIKIFLRYKDSQKRTNTPPIQFAKSGVLFKQAPDFAKYIQM
jgi:hypothetical protein